jgi:hypothetical protein
MDSRAQAAHKLPFCGRLVSPRQPQTGCCVAQPAERPTKRCRVPLQLSWPHQRRREYKCGPSHQARAQCWAHRCVAQERAAAAGPETALPRRRGSRTPLAWHLQGSASAIRTWCCMPRAAPASRMCPPPARGCRLPTCTPPMGTGAPWCMRRSGQCRRRCMRRARTQGWRRHHGPPGTRGVRSPGLLHPRLHSRHALPMGRRGPQQPCRHPCFQLDGRRLCRALAQLAPP